MFTCEVTCASMSYCVFLILKYTYQTKMFVLRKSMSKFFFFFLWFLNKWESPPLVTASFLSLLVCKATMNKKLLTQAM